MNDRAPTEKPEALASRYTLMSVLGEGGSSVVYRAVDEQTGRIVAIKRLKRAADGALVHSAARFVEEIRLLHEVRDPALVTIYEMGEDERETPYFVMEYLGEETLATWLAEHGPLAPSLMSSLLMPIARVLARLHERQIVHRDLKPANIAVVRGEAGELCAKLLDLGIAKQQGPTLTDTGVALGTPAYMAPEQALGETVGPACDIWAFGAVMYECLAGRPPFVGPTHANVLLQIVGTPAPPLRTLAPSLPEPLATLVDSTLRRDPTLRPRSMQELAEALERAGLAARDTGTAPPLASGVPPTRVSIQNEPTMVLAEVGVAAAGASRAFEHSSEGARFAASLGGSLADQLAVAETIDGMSPRQQCRGMFFDGVLAVVGLRPSERGAVLKELGIAAPRVPFGLYPHVGFYKLSFWAAARLSPQASMADALHTLATSFYPIFKMSLLGRTMAPLMGERPQQVLSRLVDAYRLCVPANTHTLELTGSEHAVWRCSVEPGPFYAQIFRGIVLGTMQSQGVELPEVTLRQQSLLDYGQCCEFDIRWSKG